jgi:hypothetical protein
MISFRICYLIALFFPQTIENKDDAVNWCTWTFFFRRLVANPYYYNVSYIV